MKRLTQYAITFFFVAALPLVTAANGHAASDEDAAMAYVDNIAGQTMKILDSSDSKASKSKKLEAIIRQHVDIDWIGKFVMGQHWRKANKAQQANYLNNYKGFILSSYAKRFTEYDGSGYKMIKARKDSADKYTVKMSIDVDGKPTAVDYKLRKHGGGYKIYDLNVEGVSLITTQRSEFNSVIQSKGIDYLIEELGNKSSSALAAAK